MRTNVVWCVLAVAGISALLNAQSFDNSANATLKGTYFVRQVLLSNVDAGTGAIGQARSLIGTATLDGNGSYTLTGTVMDSAVGAAKAINFSGTYKAASSGLAQIQNPLQPAEIIDGGIGLGAFAGSSTETEFQDFFVMIPAGTSAVSNGALR